MNKGAIKRKEEVKRGAWQNSILDREVVRRFQKLGDLGENLAEKLLEKAGFLHIQNLNMKNDNYKFADIYAERNNQRYVISVKTRNKYENNGRLNNRYKLGKDVFEFAKEVENIYKAKAAWMTIAFEADKGTFDAFFGLLTSLDGNKGVLMTEDAIREYESLALKEKLEDFGYSKEEYNGLVNNYKAR